MDDFYFSHLSVMDYISPNQLQKIAKCETYKEYIETFCEPTDVRYLRNSMIFQQVFKNTQIRAALQGALSPEEFQRIKETKEKVIVLGSFYFFCEKTTSKDPVLAALLEREKPNQHKIIATIIFILTHDTKGFEVSGYIDYEASLRTFKMGSPTERNWKNIFFRRAKLLPHHTDLSFAHWRSGRFLCNETDNFKSETETIDLKFIYKGDRKKIPAFNTKPTSVVKSFELRSKIHGYVVLLDHVIRRKT